MATFLRLTCFLWLCSISQLYSQSARIQGVVLDENNRPVSEVTVQAGSEKTSTNVNGYYLLKVPANQNLVLKFTHIRLKPVQVTVNLSLNEVFEFNPILKENEEQLSEVVINSRSRKRLEGAIAIDPVVIRKIPGANAGVENIIKSFGSVSANNELSTQYSVRGGSFDENLVYVNEIEVYRPFLVRSGQQEGLSFTNTDMVQNVEFYAGGFQSKYGDKMSSVLDITYRTPTKFGASAEGSFLGGSASVEAVSPNQKWSFLTGVRYRDNSLFVNSQETETNFRPTFADVQTYVVFRPSSKWEHSFLGNIAQNRYRNEPIFRQTNFGTIDDPIALVIDYEGNENVKYNTTFGAFKSVFKPTEYLNFRFIASAYHAVEQEYFDILAGYGYGDVNTNVGSNNLGEVEYVTRIGNQLTHARNDLDGLIVNFEAKGTYRIPEIEGKGNKHLFDFGIKYTKEDFRDRLVEYEVIDSAGFSMAPPDLDIVRNDQPYTSFEGPLVPFQSVRATNFVQVDRYSGFLQYGNRMKWGGSDVTFNVGTRFHRWTVSGENISSSSQQTFSPRAQFSLKPAWKRDMLFRLSGGYYHQPPFYREMRAPNGQVNPDVKAQESIHVVVSHDYSFKMWQRPFRLVSEAFYKWISDVNTFTVDNVRIRYAANNNAEAYAKGFDMRLNGEFVPGTESWFTFGYLKTEENINNRGFIARPTDQRLKFGILFQDYMENIPNVKVYINLVYSTGLPGGSPSYADPYVFQNRLNDYRRADVGFSYVFTEGNQNRPDGHWLKRFKDLSLGLEIFNLFNNQNSITNTWVRDTFTSRQFGVPNYLTTRVFNLKFAARI